MVLPPEPPYLRYGGVGRLVRCVDDANWEKPNRHDFYVVRFWFFSRGTIQLLDGGRIQKAWVVVYPRDIQTRSYVDTPYPLLVDQMSLEPWPRQTSSHIPLPDVMPAWAIRLKRESV